MSSRKQKQALQAAAHLARRKQGSLKASRRHSAGHLLSGQQLRQSLLVAAPPSIKIASIAGFQAALALLVALATAHLSPWPHLVGFPALGALAALFGRYDSLQHRRRIVMICGILLVAGVFIPSLASYLGATQAFMVLLLALSAGLYTLSVSSWGLGGGPGAVIFVFAVGAVLSPVDTLATVGERTLATAWGAVLAWLICALTDRLRPQDSRASSKPAAALPPMSQRLFVAARITIGAGMAALITYWSGWHYPAWAAIGATAVMQGGHLHLTMNRSLQRMAGTVVGACIVWAILVQDPSFWAVAIAVVFFQYITEVVIGYNYAFGQIAITPMALLMTHLAAPVANSNMPVERVIDTIVGAAIGIVFAVIFSSMDDRAYLARRHKKLKLWWH
ncbi:FUSC family protein [Pollutimonas harenae]|uniref:FUSC family protein n=1 Tax=Pollutimonas harenae TaxID=657015 RepID=A0A853GS25_9BURK|nr:FUSC family protein [Pollutimonas harenae]NYT84957.1 FUSC family protein [Pollutimonas harenae]TEA72651.1 FUSC family protein [Pollutimonas harenae]